MKKQFNPFSVNTYLGTSYFCDREQETQQLIENLSNQRNTIIFSYRRLGKTGLIKHVFQKLQKRKKSTCIYLDILGTSDLSELIDTLATAIYNAVPPQRSIAQKIVTAIQSLRPTISFDELTGVPSIGFNLQNEIQKKNTLSALFTFLDQQEIEVFIAIDEFQQILEYPEKNTDAILRTYIQTLKNVHFIFSGSNQKMMHELFNNAKRPFFASCSGLHLSNIPEKKYSSFIKKHFKAKGAELTKEALNFIYEWNLGHTFYIQYFCNQLYFKAEGKISLENVKDLAAELFVQLENNFYQYRNLLSEIQWKTLVAVSKSERLYQPNGKKFIQENKLGTASSVNRSLAALVEKEMIFYNSSAERPYYETYDKFLMRWMKGR